MREATERGATEPDLVPVLHEPMLSLAPPRFLSVDDAFRRAAAGQGQAAAW